MGGCASPCLSHVEWKQQSLDIAYADLSVSLRQMRKKVRALRDDLGARDIKGEVPEVREPESVPGTRQRLRGDIQKKLKINTRRLAAGPPRVEIAMLPPGLAGRFRHTLLTTPP